MMTVEVITKCLQFRKEQNRLSLTKNPFSSLIHPLYHYLNKDCILLATSSGLTSINERVSISTHIG